MSITRKRPNQQTAHSPILHAASDTYYWKGTGSLSVKTFFHGSAFYQTGYGHHAVEEGSYLLVNRGQEYAITIEAAEPVESFCLFFPDGMAEEVYRCMRSSASHLLDEPVSFAWPQVDFVEKTYRNDHLLMPEMLDLRAHYKEKQNEGMWLEEKLHTLMQQLLQVHRDVLKEMEKLPLVRRATREEVYRRIHVGRDYIDAYYRQPLTIGELARAACMSPNHFLRCFKQFFGMTPHQYVTEKRLEQAKRLLLGTDKSVTEICLEVGYQSPATFSSLFSRRFSVSPSRFRQKGDFE